VDQLRDFADDRLLVGCIYCGGQAQTRDHVPSKVFLDSPFPDNLPVVSACDSCNNGFSADEEYVACLVEAAVLGTTNPEAMRRPTVAGILRRVPGLRFTLDAARREVDGRPALQPDQDRVFNVVLKLARGHAAFELSQPCREPPTSVRVFPIAALSREEWEEFDAGHFPGLLPEVGSRASQRIMAVQPTLTAQAGRVISLPGFAMQDWQEVQDKRYSYLATADGSEIRVRIVIGGYMGCDVRWAM
jgi:hypothetical protein